MLNHVEITCGKAAKQVVCDMVTEVKVEANGTVSKDHSTGEALQRVKKRKQCGRRAAVESVIDHLKSGYRIMARNYLKSVLGDHINLLMAVHAWNQEQ